MSPELIIGFLGVLGLGAVGAAIVTGLFSKKKLGAEATNLIAQAASSVTQRLENELKRSDEKAVQREKEHADERRLLEEKMDAMAEAHVAEREEWKRVLQLHVSWDAIALAKLAEVGVELPPVPPVTPPIRHVDEHGRPLAHPQRQG